VSQDGRKDRGSDLDEVIRLGRKRDLVGLERELRMSSSEMARAAAARSLGRLGDRGVADALIESLTDESEHVKIAAAQAIAKVGDDDAATALIRALPDAAPVTQQWILETLVSLRSLEAREPLAKYLNGDKARLRLWAAKQLGRLGDPGSIELIEERTRHESWLRRWRMVRIARAARK